MERQDLVIHRLRGFVFDSRREFLSFFPFLINEGIVKQVASKQHVVTYTVTETIKYKSPIRNADGTIGYTLLEPYASNFSRDYALTSIETDWIGREHDIRPFA